MHMDRYEQYVILLSSNRLIGPMTVTQYQEFVTFNPELMQGIDDLLEKDDMRNGSGLPLRECPPARPSAS